MDNARALVAEYHGLSDNVSAYSTMVPVVHITTADTGELDRYNDIVCGIDFRNWAILERDLVGLL